MERDRGDGASTAESSKNTKESTRPGVELTADALTPKDIDDLRFGVALGVDMVALSFVRSADDIVARPADTVRDRRSAAVPLVAKIERPEALDHLDEILKVAQGVMVARGDLGLEMPLEKVPTSQKEITRKARAAGIPVIVATQVLESMRPSRGRRAQRSAMLRTPSMTALTRSCWPAKRRSGCFP